MTKKEKAKIIHGMLDELFPTTPIPLDHKDPYTLLIAVLLSAQCTDERVNKITPALFELADNPKDKRTVNDIPQGRCRTNQDECEDCRNRPIEEVVSAHFTLCQKPWLCLPQDSDIIQQRLCRKLHHEWHRIRSDLEKGWGRSAEGDGKFQSEHFLGHCSKFGQAGYLPIKEPFGLLKSAHFLLTLAAIHG